MGFQKQCARLAWVVSCAAGSVHAADFVGTNLGAIPDNNPAGIDVTFPVSGMSAPLGDVSVSMTLNHTWAGDLEATLIAPNGKARRVLFGRLGVHTVEDVLYHIPHRYDDYSKHKQIGELTIGDMETIVATVESVKVFNARGRQGTEVTVGDGYWTACRALERTCCVEEIWVQSPRLVRTDYLRETGGFLESLSGTEDAELRTRMIADGRPLAWIPDEIVHDEGRMSLGFIWSKRYYYGRGQKRYRAEHPGALSVQAGSAVGAYRRHWRRLAAKPTVAAGVVFLRAGELAAYGIGAAIGALERPERPS